MYSNIDQYIGVDGRLIQYAWPGGYPIIYIDGDNSVLCPDCANKEFKQLEDDDPNKPRIGMTYMEGSPYHCAECNCELPSAYGVPDED